MTSASPRRRQSYQDAPWKKDDPFGKPDTVRHIWDEGAVETYCHQPLWPLTISRSDRGTRDCIPCARVAAKRAQATGEPVRRPRDPAAASLAEREAAHARQRAAVREWSMSGRTAAPAVRPVRQERSPVAEFLADLRGAWHERFIDTIDTDAAAWNARFAFDAEEFDTRYIARALDARFAHASSPEATAFVGAVTLPACFDVERVAPDANRQIALAVAERLEAPAAPRYAAEMPDGEAALLGLLRRERGADVLLGVYVSGQGFVRVTTVCVMLVVRSEDASMQLTAIEQVGGIGQRGPCLAEVGEALSRLGMTGVTEDERRSAR